VAQAQTNIGVGLPGGELRGDNFPSGTGYGFYSPAGIGSIINALGFWDQNETGLASNHTVALYQFNGANYSLIASATIQAGTVDPLIDGYRWASIPTVSLPDIGQGADYYVILASQGGGDNWTDWTSGISMNPSIGTTTGSGAFFYDGVNNIGVSPANLNVGSGQGVPNPYGGANLAFIQPAPEPAACALLGSGIIMLLAMRRKSI
jgi:hypothetical protein